MRLIDADALRKAMFSYYPCVNEHSLKHNYCGDTLMDYEVADLIDDCIDNAPDIEAEPVKHGRWHDCYQIDEFHYIRICSECANRNVFHKYDSVGDYCPNCGARMDGEPNG